MNNEELLKEIRSRGYWRVEVRSTEYQDSRLPNCAAMKNLMSSATVSLRGWPYPYFRAEEATYNGKWLEGQVNWDNFREYWRLYESGQWLHFLGLPGAWITRERLFQHRSPLPPQHAGYLHVRGDILYILTEILRFAVGLGQGGILSPTAFLSIQLHNTRDYVLYESFERFFRYDYVNKSDRPIEQKYTLPVNELSAVSDQMALDVAIKVFSVFGWVPVDAAIRTLAEDQKKLIERRL